MNNYTASLSVYNASAGSGKTTTLIKEILKLIISDEKNGKEFNENKIRRILGLTFTNAVANELKERVVRVLHSIVFDKGEFEKSKEIYFKDVKLSDDEIKERAQKVLSYILHNYSDVSLQTIDSFSNRVLKSFAYELNYSVAYEVSTEVDLYYDRALDNYFDEINSKDDEKLKLILEYILKQKDEYKETYKVKNFWVDIIDILKPLAEKETGILALNVIKENLNKINEIELRKLYNTNRIELNKRIESFNNKVKNILHKYFFIENNEVKKDNNKGVNGRKINSLNLLYNDGFNNFDKYFLEKDNKEFFNKGFEKKNESFVNEFSTLENEYNSLVNINESTDLINALLNGLVVTKFAIQILEILNDLKREDDVVFFSDFTKEISKIIQNESNVDFIFERVGTRYRNFLIDEFQDTSTLQFHNLLPLIHNSMSEGHKNFIVGDPKQSIYKWRNANVRQFVELYNNKSIDFERLKRDWEKFKNNIQCLNLEYNYRSAKEIVDFNNKIFNGLTYDNIEIIESVYKNAEQIAFKQDIQGYVEIIEYDCSKGGSLSNKEDRIIEFAEDVFERIKECINDGYQQKDICVILRTNEEIKKVIELLRGREINNNESIEFITAEGLSLNISKDIDFIIAFLNLLLNHQDRFTSGICWSYVNKKKFNYNERFNKNFYSEYSQKEEFKQLFSIRNLYKEDLYQLCLDIIKYFGIEQNIYVQKFLDIINKFMHSYASQGNTIERFLEFWEKNKEEFRVSLSSDLNAIKIMTVHKSKGLEFPVVFTYLNFNQKNNSKYWIKIPESVNFNLPVKDTDAEKHLNGFKNNYFYLNITDIEKIDKNEYDKILAEEHLENINIIYVAFTRAIDRLYIFADDKNDYYKSIVSPKIENFEKEITKDNKDVNKNKIIYTYGQKNKPSRNQPLQKQKYEIDENIKLCNNENILLADHFNVYSDEIFIGIKIHKALEFLNSNDIDYAVKKAKAKGIIRENETEYIKSMLQNIIEHAGLKKYFITENIKYILNEHEIYTNDNNTYRPDKIIFTKNNEIAVIEFKTGSESTTHHKQISNYMHLIQEQYPSVNINGFLIYLSFNENENASTLDVKEIKIGSSE